MEHNNKLLTLFTMCFQMLARKCKFLVWFSFRVTPMLANSKPLVVVEICVFMWVVVWSLLCKDVWCMQPRVKSHLGYSNICAIFHLWWIRQRTQHAPNSHIHPRTKCSSHSLTIFSGEYSQMHVDASPFLPSLSFLTNQFYPKQTATLQCVSQPTNHSKEYITLNKHNINEYL